MEIAWNPLRRPVSRPAQRSKARQRLLRNSDHRVGTYKKEREL